MKILILSISAGIGHIKAALAIKDYMEVIYDNCAVEIVDALKYIHPFIDKLIIGGYLKTVKNSPILFGKLYNASDNDTNISNLGRLFNDFISSKLKDMIKEFMPDIIVATHPFHLEMLSVLKVKQELDIPVIAVITDFSIHSFWIHNYVDAYVIPDEDLKHELLNKGIDNSIVFPYGIPVNTRFLKQFNKQSILCELGFDEKPTILIMGGGLGIGSIKKIFRLLAFSKIDVQIIVVTGNNSRLRCQIDLIAKNCNKKIRVFSFTDKIPEFMSISDLLITKPGGVTISEALVKELPIAIIAPIPGQEEKNCEYLLNKDIAVRLEKNENHLETILNILNNKDRLLQMKLNSKLMAKPDAVRNISDLIMSFSKNKESIEF